MTGMSGNQVQDDGGGGGGSGGRGVDSRARGERFWPAQLVVAQ